MGAFFQHHSHATQRQALHRTPDMAAAWAGMPDCMPLAVKPWLAICCLRLYAEGVQARHLQCCKSGQKLQLQPALRRLLQVELSAAHPASGYVSRRITQEQKRSSDGAAGMISAVSGAGHHRRLSGALLDW